jgi:hypothetical protein
MIEFDIACKLQHGVPLSLRAVLRHRMSTSASWRVCFEELEGQRERCMILRSHESAQHERSDALRGLRTVPCKGARALARSTELRPFCRQSRGRLVAWQARDHNTPDCRWTRRSSTQWPPRVSAAAPCGCHNHPGREGSSRRHIGREAKHPRQFRRLGCQGACRSRRSTCSGLNARSASLTTADTHTYPRATKAPAATVACRRNRRMLNIARTHVRRRRQGSSLAISGPERAAGRLALLPGRSRVSTTTTCHRAPQTSERRSSGGR